MLAVLLSWLGLLGVAVSFGAAPSHATDGSVQVTRFTVSGQRGGRESAIAVWPRVKRAKGETLPVVFAFHGRGEAKLGPGEGYRAWVDRYGLTE